MKKVVTHVSTENNVREMCCSSFASNHEYFLFERKFFNHKQILQVFVRVADQSKRNLRFFGARVILFCFERKPSFFLFVIDGFVLPRLLL